MDKPDKEASVNESTSWVGHVTPADGNIFADLGIEPGEAEELLVRAELLAAVQRILRARRVRPKKAARTFGVSEEVVQELRRNRIDDFSTEELIRMLGRAGMRINVTVSRTSR
ncbi:MAG TPA: XRE family transcriptional regulator [Longimicrobium sp.]|uniref:helix-turn-helix domain-containing protein n=1 Tax=Longimicrobium sp. TaxID=2029185 RepID=UPI002ED95DAB